MLEGGLLLRVVVGEVFLLVDVSCKILANPRDLGAPIYFRIKFPYSAVK